MHSLIAVDWGTSSLRAARIAADGTVLEERSFPRGTLTVPAGGFPAVLQESCGDWLADPAALCLVSGMAGSRQGWREAPYCACPAGFAELASRLEWIVPERIAIVPGLSCEHGGVPDVMRGEEVQVFGAMDLLAIQDGLFVLPGTHSKWVRAEQGRIVSFATAMTGEVYALLRQHSILARTLPAEDGALDEDAFLQGVRQAGADGSLLRSAFSVRTLSLLDRMPPGRMPSYLSGLVIGEELRTLAARASEVVLIGSAALTQRYAVALQSIDCNVRPLGAQATWHGLHALARTLERT
jgi:2-dehydro-3-deoxygalactonokinase